MNKNKQHIIFDLDGTIIDSRDEIIKTYEAVINEIPPEILPNLRSLNYGLTLNDFLVSIYGRDIQNINAARQLFISIYDSSEYDETHLYEGAYELLPALRQDGFELYIATNKRLLPTTRILERKKILHLFAHIAANEMQAGITLTKRQMISELKQKGSFLEGYMVGDSISDILAGQDENLTTIAVNYGYEKEEVLAALNPACSVNSFQNLYTFVTRDSKY